MPAVIRIEHIATRDTTVVVTRHRQDVPAGEPHTLVAEDRLAPGRAITLHLAAGEVVTVHEDSDHG